MSLQFHLSLPSTPSHLSSSSTPIPSIESSQEDSCHEKENISGESSPVKEKQRNDVSYSVFQKSFNNFAIKMQVPDISTLGRGGWRIKKFEWEDPPIDLFGLTDSLFCASLKQAEGAIFLNRKLEKKYVEVPSLVRAIETYDEAVYIADEKYVTWENENVGGRCAPFSTPDGACIGNLSHIQADEGQLLYVCSDNGIVRRLRVGREEEVTTLGQIAARCFNEKSPLYARKPELKVDCFYLHKFQQHSFLFVARNDGYIDVWSPQLESWLEKSIFISKKVVTCLQGYNQFLFAGFSNKRVGIYEYQPNERTWQSIDKNETGTLNCSTQFESIISAMHIFNGNLFLGFKNGNVMIIELPSRKWLHLLKVHETAISQLKESCKEGCLYASGVDGTVKVLSLSTSKEGP